MVNPNGRGADVRPAHSTRAPGPTVPPPGPAPRPLGLPPDDFDRDPVACLARLRHEHGDVFTFARDRVAVARPAWVHWALVRTGRETRVDLAPNRETGRESIVHDEVETWMASRRTAQWHRLGRDIAERTAPFVRRRLSAFMDAAADSTVRLADCQAAVLEAAERVFVRDLEGPLRQAFLTAADLLQKDTSSSLALPLWLSARTRRRLRANTAWIEALVAHVRARRTGRDPADPPSDMLDLLVDARGEEGPAFTDLQVAQSLSINLGNLHQVGGTALAWLLAAHAEHGLARPDAVDREDWNLAVVKETLRAYPAVTLTRRVLLEDVGFGDVTVPAGHSVYLSPLLLHTDPRWWREDPGRFDPARWLAEEVHDPHAYLPYGAGPRRCTGDHLANAVLETAADLLADRTVTGTSGLPGRRWGSVTQPRRLRISITRAEAPR